MGFELDRIMKQYGVSTPGVVNYSGAAVPLPPKEPVAPAAGSENSEGDSYPAAQTKYQADLAAYQASLPELTRKYDADQAAYNTYKTDYQNRVQSTPMYLQSQFQTAPQPAAKTVSDLYKMYLGRDPEAGIAGSAAASTRPNFIQEAQNELNTKPNFGNQNLMNITGSYYGNQLKNPVYAAQVAPVATPVVGTNNALLNASNFDSKAYLAANPDVASEIDRGVQNFGDAYGHYTRYGKNEGRAASMVAAHGGSVHDLADKYAYGGQVKTNFMVGGSNNLGGFNDMADKYDVQFTGEMPDIGMVPTPGEPIMYAAAPVAKTTATDAGPAAVTPKAPAALPFGGERLAGIQALLDSYGPKESTYAADLATARAAAKTESDAFTTMLTNAMNSPEDAQSSKAEMYFRLAAAFGAPTRTGQFAENLGMVGKELGEYAKGKRAASQQKLGLALKGQEMKMGAAKEDLNTLRALTGEEMKDKRAIATELIKDYIKSGEPQSAAGKQALDEGLKAGSPEYQKRVAEIGNMKVEAQMAQITSTLANMGTAQANLALAQEKFKNQQTQQAKLTAPEVKLKTEAEDMLGSTTQAMNDLKRAYSLNDNTFDSSLPDTAQRKLLEAAGSKDPKVLNTREQENLLQKGALAQLKSTFPGAISDAETKTLQALQGLNSKSKEERALIMKNAFRTLKAVEERSKKRLVDINSGTYRETVPTPQGLE
jgi:hypothetical protein